MEKIETLAGMEQEEIEALFRERAAAAVESMSIDVFSDVGLEPARSEKEIEKCTAMLAKNKRIAEEREEAASRPARPRRPRESNKRGHGGRRPPRPSHRDGRDRRARTR